MMKILNKFSVLSVLMIALLMFVTSCTDEDKDNLNGVLLKTGGFPRFDQNPPTSVGVDEISDLTYNFTVLDGNDNLTLYDLKMHADISGTRTDTVDVTQFTSFPSSLSFTDEDLASLLGITSADIGFGDQFFFSGVATTDEGLVYGAANSISLIEVFQQPDGTYLDDDEDEVTVGATDSIVLGVDGKTFLQSGQGVTDDILNNPGYKQAFKFNFIILCPDVFTAGDFAGTWQITEDPFGTFLDDGIFEIIVGPEANQVTMVDPFAHTNPDTGETYDVIIDFDPTSGAVTIEEQPAWHCDNFGCSFGEGSIEGGGFVFICVDLMKLQLENTVEAGSFGISAMDMVKLNL